VWAERCGVEAVGPARWRPEQPVKGIDVGRSEAVRWEAVHHGSGRRRGGGGDDGSVWPDLGGRRCGRISVGGGAIRSRRGRCVGARSVGKKGGGNIGASRRRREEHRGGAAASRSPAALTRVLQINGEGEEENLG
jgi:hypothetical protein